MNIENKESLKVLARIRITVDFYNLWTDETHWLIKKISADSSTNNVFLDILPDFVALGTGYTSS